MQRQQRILIAPLDWGLGHATRCIPIIRSLLKKNTEVIIATEGRPMELLKKEFPTLEFVSLDGYTINYPNKGSMVLKMFFMIPKILIGIYREHTELKQIIKEKNIDCVISDNRFGLWNENVKSIFITHQLMIKSPFAEKLLHKINLFFINKYDECWVPDNAGAANLSGDLAHSYQLPRNTFFIGILSRFEKRREDEPVSNYTYDVMAIISGPEPQRTLFEKMLLNQLKGSGLKALVVCGKPEEGATKEAIEKVKIVNHLNSEEMQEAILNSKLIIARSGYSTIMDLAALGKKAFFVPTPGQTEQEYLAVRLKEKQIAFFQQQSNFDLREGIRESEKHTGFAANTADTELENRIDALLKIPA